MLHIDNIGVEKLIIDGVEVDKLYLDDVELYSGWPTPTHSMKVSYWSGYPDQIGYTWSWPACDISPDNLVVPGTIERQRRFIILRASDGKRLHLQIENGIPNEEPPAGRWKVYFTDNTDPSFNTYCLTGLGRYAYTDNKHAWVWGIGSGAEDVTAILNRHYSKTMNITIEWIPA